MGRRRKPPPGFPKVQSVRDAMVFDSGSHHPLLSVRDLVTSVATPSGANVVVDHISFDLDRGETLCIAGESGSGKSMTALSLMRLLPEPMARIAAGQALFKGRDLFRLAEAEMRSVRGNDIGMIFQEPMTSLGPVQTIGSQIMDAIRLHFRIPKKEARDRAIEILKRVGMPRAEERLDAYPFQLSGGMRQRAMIALALSCQPRLLIADEPTTALDVTTQAVILDLIRELQDDMGMAVMFITHDLGVVAEIADTVAVMYLGRVIERADVDDIFHSPKHPYTRGLLRSVPRLGIAVGEDPDAIEGMVPGPYSRPTGCSFHPRCREMMPGICDRIEPGRTDFASGRSVRCLLHDPEMAGNEPAEQA